MSNEKILVIDDELNIREVLSAILQKEGYEVKAVESAEKGLEQIHNHDFNLIITDIRLPLMSGVELLKEVNSLKPDIPVIMITAYGTIDTAVEAMKQGAYDFITKPFNKDEMKIVVNKALNTQKINKQEVFLPLEFPGRYNIIGNSYKMQQIYKTIEKVSSSNATVLIYGESGTGKELIARAIHYNSLRKAKPFIKVNCGALPENLLESELFGYEKGAFTGAVTSKPGRFELAHLGTLFLDEIGNLSQTAQVKLLRVLQEKEFERVGGIKTVQVDVRLICATNLDLKKETSECRFREDLYYRLNVVPIILPPLRQRKEDIPILVEYFLSRFNIQNKKQIKGIEQKALQYLINYPWYGNIRELENVIERIVVLTTNEYISYQNLPDEIKEIEHKKEEAPLKDKKQEVEKEIILKALEDTYGNITNAANMLGISRRSLQLKMKRYGLRGKVP